MDGMAPEEQQETIEQLRALLQLAGRMAVAAEGVCRAHVSTISERVETLDLRRREYDGAVISLTVMRQEGKSRDIPG